MSRVQTDDSMPARFVVGCMTGTSIDGLDTALMRIGGRGLDMRASFIGGLSRPIGSAEKILRSLAAGETVSARHIAEAATAFALAHADSVASLCNEHGIETRKLELVAVHGQTVAHAPPNSWQLINPWPIAARLGAPIVFDLRGADLAAGGQGAPITPLADWVLFREANVGSCIVNLGGFCNITAIPPQPAQGDALSWIASVHAKDVCACNHVLDAVARNLLGSSYDTNGGSASMGSVHPIATTALEKLLGRQKDSGRSLGSGDEAAAWIVRIQSGEFGALTPADTARSACSALAKTIASELEALATDTGSWRVLLAGGGVKNRALVGELTAALRTLSAAARRRSLPFDPDVQTTEALGIPIQFREAAAMGVLGALCADKTGITLRHVTGCTYGVNHVLGPLAGVWAYPSDRR